MNIQIASDLHLELKWNEKYFENNPLIPSADVLILAGDIMCFDVDRKFLEHPFWNRISCDFKQVYLLLGNHEYYGGIDVELFQGSFEIRNNIHLMNNITEVLDDNLFIFTTLWSSIPIKYRQVMSVHVNDFKYINRRGATLSVEDYNELHNLSLTFIKEQLCKDYKNKVLISHHVPLLQLLPERLRNLYAYSLYSNHLDDIIKSNNIHTWVYGHSHFFSSDCTFYNTSFCSNPFGYKKNKENPYFMHDKCIVI